VGVRLRLPAAVRDDQKGRGHWIHHSGCRRENAECGTRLAISNTTKRSSGVLKRVWERGSLGTRKTRRTSSEFRSAAIILGTFSILGTFAPTVPLCERPCIQAWVVYNRYWQNGESRVKFRQLPSTPKSRRTRKQVMVQGYYTLQEAAQFL